MAENRAIGIWLLRTCIVGLFVLCFAYIDARASGNSLKEFQTLLQAVSDLGSNSSNSRETLPPGSSPHLIDGNSRNSASPAEALEPQSRTAKASPGDYAMSQASMSQAPASHNKSLSDCDFCQGRWVYDETYPLYRSKNCRFVDPGFQCVENGRPDTEFMKYRWQPHDCDLPRFDPKDMLERLRNQRVVFVGDSLGRNHWESMLCMLSEGVQNKSRIYEINGEPIKKHTGSLVFRFQDYNCTVAYYREPFLVPQTRPPPGAPSDVKSVLLIDEPAWSIKQWWPGADILVFNTGNWWVQDKIDRWGARFQVGSNLTAHSLEDAFQFAMKTWALWMEKNLEMTTKLFFRSFAPRHFRGGSWESGGHCDESVKPLTHFEGQRKKQSTHWTNNVILDAINQYVTSKRAAVEFLDITVSANYRADGHPGAYSDLPPGAGQDCSHFCLPGVPDSWNEILYASLLKTEKAATTTTTSRS